MLGPQIIAIDRALAKLDEGTYGYSDISGLPIPITRLQALPHALRTIAEEPPDYRRLGRPDRDP